MHATSSTAFEAGSFRAPISRKATGRRRFVISAISRHGPGEQFTSTAPKRRSREIGNPAVFAVVIATADHWHAPATILACDAGKDVYVEKPASHNLREGRLMVDAARRGNRIVQLGTQSRSRPSTRRAIELVRSGKIGKVL